MLLGTIESEKETVINTLFGQTKSEFRTTAGNSVKRKGKVNGRKVILIDTPRWWGTFPLIDTAEVIKQKLILSVSMCPPGPHAFILAVSTDIPFTEKNRRSIEEHIGIFGENVWERTIVVFTRGEYMEGTIEQHIEREGEALKGLVEKCGNRYHMFGFNSMENCKTVDQLLDQIDCIVANTGINHFKYDENKIMEIEEKQKMNRERARLRHQSLMDQRQILHNKYGKSPMPYFG